MRLNDQVSGSIKLRNINLDRHTTAFTATVRLDDLQGTLVSDFDGIRVEPAPLREALQAYADKTPCRSMERLLSWMLEDAVAEWDLAVLKKPLSYATNLG